jgi:hypothetical protein
MRRVTGILMALALLLGGDGQANAAIVYDDGAIDGAILSSHGGALDIEAASAVSDSFTVAGPALLTGAQNVGIWVNPDATPLSVHWSIGTSPFASDVSSGTSTLSGAFVSGNVGGWWVYDESFSLNGLVSNVTEYYLTLTGAAASDGSYVLWDVDFGTSSAEFEPNGGSPIAVDAESFQLVGNEGSATPEPSSIVLLGMGITGLGVARWRKRKQAA